MIELQEYGIAGLIMNSLIFFIKIACYGDLEPHSLIFRLLIFAVANLGSI